MSLCCLLFPDMLPPCSPFSCQGHPFVCVQTSLPQIRLPKLSDWSPVCLVICLPGHLYAWSSVCLVICLPGHMSAWSSDPWSSPSSSVPPSSAGHTSWAVFHCRSFYIPCPFYFRLNFCFLRCVFIPIASLNSFIFLQVSHFTLYICL